MKVTVLGSGTSQGVPVIACECEVCKSSNTKDKRTRCSILIETNGKVIVVDTGPDFRYQMLRADVKDLDAVLFTHEHKDHLAGLDDIRAFNFKRGGKPMDVFANKDVQEALKREYSYIFAKNKYPGIPKINLKSISNQKFHFEGIEITPIEVLHYKLPVLGFRVKNFAYITDANFISETEKKKLKKLDILILNALRKTEHISHYNLEQAIDLIHELKPKKAYLTHISHLMGKHEEVSKELPHDIEIAYDGLKINLD